jgi:phenylalanyl-tRNA synthetase beta chain
MKVSLRWLRDLLPGLPGDADEVAGRLTGLGLEVEAIHRIGAGLEPVVVAAVVSIEPHPTKSGLRLVTVDRGTGTQKVVCGAPNVPDPGGLVVLAPLGTHLPAKNMTIEPRAIGGVVSEGMLCSESELGIGEGSGGILILDAGSARAGQPLLEALPFASDAVFEVGVTPNRPDALGHIGVARDLAAALGLPFSVPSATDVPRGAPPASARVRVTIEDVERCGHYGAAVVSGVALGPSPLWARVRLWSLGVRPISNVVDLTNLMMLEAGHPMHAFDLDRVNGAEIRVRRARSGETLKTLDGKDRDLSEDDLVIADATAAIALGGVMGGASTEIGDGTKQVLLECAWFDPRGVRRTSKRHGLHSESSHRFERGVDRGGVRAVLARATSLLIALAGGTAAEGEVHAEVAPPPRPSIRLRGARVDALLGVTVPWAEVTGILTRLGFEVQGGGEAEAQATPPSWRPDVAREADLIEEIARVRGLDRIPAELPRIFPQAPRTTGDVERRVRAAAVELGLSEAVTYAFVSPRELAILSAPPSLVTMVNPMTEERSVLRTSLLPGLLEATVRARRHGERSARLFTLGRTFHAPAPGASLPTERRGVAVVVGGARPSYLSRLEDHDVFDAKALAVEIVRRATRREPTVIALREASPAHLHPRGGARVEVDGRVVGTFGPLHPDVVAALDLDASVQTVELDLDALDALGIATPKARPVPRLPAVTRDVALVVTEDVAAGDVEKIVRDEAGPLCEAVELFDVFRGGAISAGSRSLAFHLVYRDPKARTGEEGARTLTDAEVDTRHAAVVAAVKAKLGASLRA